MSDNKNQNEVEAHDDDYKAKKKALRKRVPAGVSIFLSIKIVKLVEILDKFNIERIDIKEVKDWIAIPEIAPPHGKEILELWEANKKSQAKSSKQSKNTSQTANKTPEETHEKTVERIIQKLKAKAYGNLNSKERTIILDDLYYLSRGLVGMRPEDAEIQYGDDEYAQLITRYENIKLDDHTTYQIHLNNCDFQGKEDSCQDRLDKMNAAAREDARLKAGLKEISIMTSNINKGDIVLFYFDSKIGIVKRVNKVSYTIEGIGNNENAGLMKKYRMHPDYVSSTKIENYPVHEVGDEVLVKCIDGHKRLSKIVEKRDVFYLVEYKVKSKDKTAYCWIDPLRFVAPESNL